MATCPNTRSHLPEKEAENCFACSFRAHGTGNSAPAGVVTVEDEEREGPPELEELAVAPHLGDLYTESWQFLHGSFSAVSKPNFASK